jgi:hypothetical protein
LLQIQFKISFLNRRVLANTCGMIESIYIFITGVSVDLIAFHPGFIYMKPHLRFAFQRETRLPKRSGDL